MTTNLSNIHTGPSRERKGGSFPGPGDVWGPVIAQKFWKGCSDGFFLISNMHKIHFRLGELTMLPRVPSRMVMGHPPISSLLRSRRQWNEVVIGPRVNGFPGPAVSLDGPAYKGNLNNAHKNTANDIVVCNLYLSISADKTHCCINGKWLEYWMTEFN